MSAKETWYRYDCACGVNIDVRLEGTYRERMSPSCPDCGATMDFRGFSEADPMGWGGRADDLTVDVRNGCYTISRGAWEATCEAKRQGAQAKRDGVKFHENPFSFGATAKNDWLYAAWEYGYIHGDGPEAMGRICLMSERGR